MRRFLPLLLICAGCSSSGPEIKRLSPVMGTSRIPEQCRVVSVLPNSPADKAGVRSGDTLKTVNGKAPANAAALSDLVGAAPEDSLFEIVTPEGRSNAVKVRLSKERPRLGAVCDLAGWEKPGVTAAGNESITVFSGAYALTASGILDKGIAFLRVRVANNSDKPMQIDPTLFTLTDGSGAQAPTLPPKEVMCTLYGDKGAYLLSLKKKRKETPDGFENFPSSSANPDDRCPTGPKGRYSSSDAQFVEANAEYMATESLWPATFQPGSVADGLIYLKEPSLLPLALSITIDGQTLNAKLGTPVAKTQTMKHSELVTFFEAQKKGASMRITLKKGKVVVGKFSSYDPVDERAWFHAPSGGMLNSLSYSLESIRYAESLDNIPSKAPATSGDLN